MKLAKLKKARPKKIAVIDVETYGFGAFAANFAFGVLLYDEIYEVFYDVKKMKQAILALKNYVVFAHFAEYDLLTIFGNIYTELDKSAIFIGSSFICAKCEGVTFYDSYKLFPTKLKNLGESLGCLKGDYNSLHLERGQKFTTEMIDYCKRDCEIVYKAVLRSFDLVGAIKPTIGSASLFFFRRCYLENDLYFNELVYDFGLSYYGGRTEAFYIGDCIGFCYDINSMYPWAMKKKFPNPDKLTKITSATVQQLMTMLKAGYEGVAKVKVLSYENNLFPLLPTRLNNKLMFVNGYLTGYYNFNELKYFLDTKQGELLEVFDCTFSKGSIESPFKKFIDEVYTLRKNSQGFDNLMYKNLLNNNYGKFAEKAHGKKTYYESLPAELIKSYVTDNKKFKIHLFSEERKDCYIELFENEKKYAKTAIPLFSSYITSYARILLHQNMVANKDNTVLYCDTDSIILKKPLMSEQLLSNELGFFKLEQKLFTEIRGCKNYDFVEIDETGFFDLHRRIKGIPKNAIETDTYIYKYKSMVKTLGALRRNLKAGEFIETTKKICNIYDKRKVLLDGNTLPFFLDTNNNLV